MPDTRRQKEYQNKKKDSLQTPPNMGDAEKPEWASYMKQAMEKALTKHFGEADQTSNSALIA